METDFWEQVKAKCVSGTIFDLVRRYFTEEEIKENSFFESREKWVKWANQVSDFKPKRFSFSDFKEP